MKNKWVKPLIIVLIIAALIFAGIKIVPSLLEGRGVQASTEDIMMVVNSCKPYLIGIGCALAALIIVLLATASDKVNGKTRFILRRQSFVAFLLIAMLMINMICNGPISALLNVSMGAKGEMAEETRDESGHGLEQTGAQGFPVGEQG